VGNFLNTSLLPHYGSKMRCMQAASEQGKAEQEDEEDTTAVKLHVSDETARIALHRLGFRPHKHRKGLYVDGHDREDVLDYRKKFLQILKTYDPYLVHCMPTPAEVAYFASLPREQRPFIIVVQDETIFYSLDGHPVYWATDDWHDLRPKGTGRGLMASVCITEIGGVMHAATEFLAYHKGEYW